MSTCTSIGVDSFGSEPGFEQLLSTTEFAGWSKSAKQILPIITHKGDCLKADEEGERFDAGAEATWATRKPGKRVENDRTEQETISKRATRAQDSSEQPMKEFPINRLFI